MYGVIPIANSVAFENAPPESVFRYAIIFEPASVTSVAGAITCASTFESRNGTGITEPILKTMMIKSVNKSFLRRSGIDHAFFIILNN